MERARGNEDRAATDLFFQLHPRVHLSMKSFPFSGMEVSSEFRKHHDEQMSYHSPNTKGKPAGFARFLLLFAALASLAGCNSEEKATEAMSQPAKTAPESKPVLVDLARVERGMIEQTLERSAPLEAEAHVQVRARTQNPAIELLVEEGDKVTNGQVLLRLENDRQKTDNNQAMSQLEQARIDFARQESLYNQKLIS
jgi:membrane fusion protein (multidrug efflux system)